MLENSPCIEKQLKGHHGALTAIDFSPNGKQFVTSSYDRTILLWDLREEIKNCRYRGHDDAVLDVSYSSSGTYLASASRDHTVRLWMSGDDGSVSVLNAHSSAVKTVQFDPDGSQFLTAGDDGWFKIWAVGQQSPIYGHHAHKTIIHHAKYSNDGTIITTTSNDKTIKLWTNKTGEPIHVYKTDDVGVHLNWHPIGYLLAVATTGGAVIIYDIRTHCVLQRYTIHENVTNQIAFHPSGNYIITASKDHTIKIVDLKKGARIFTLRAHNGSVNAVKFSPSGNHFISGGEDQMICLWKTNFVLRIQSNIQNQYSLGRTQSSRPKASIWKQCYHNSRFPIVTFFNNETESNKHSDSEEDVSFEFPTAISTPRTATQNISTSMTPNSARDRIIPTSQRSEEHSNELPSVTINETLKSNRTNDRNCNEASENVGDASHIPRCPPSPQCYKIPSVIAVDKEELYGMISLKENDVCYTSGTIEWVGKKRNLPITGGFKILHDRVGDFNAEPRLKRFKNSHTKSFCDTENIRSCECADVLPTVNAIVDHLNALHEAVDIVDIRLNAIENNVQDSNK